MGCLVLECKGDVMKLWKRGAALMWQRRGWSMGLLVVEVWEDTASSSYTENQDKASFTLAVDIYIPLH